jgi:hypothetical protein
MRFLYKEYYQKKKRGFTEEELKNAFDLLQVFRWPGNLNTSQPLKNLTIQHISIMPG